MEKLKKILPDILKMILFVGLGILFIWLSIKDLSKDDIQMIFSSMALVNNPRGWLFISLSVEQKLNKKVWNLAFKRVLSDKLAAGEVIVVDKFDFEAPKTKLMAKLLKDLGVERSAVVVQKDADETVILVTSNLPRIDYSTARAIDVYTLMVSKQVVCDQAGFDALIERLAK